MESYKQIRTTTAGILLVDDRYFVARRSAGGAIGGLWEFPGGKNRWGETEAETLIREYQEELNLDVSVGSLLHTHDFVNKDTLYHLKAYRIFCADFGPLKLSVHDEYRWVDGRTLSTLSFAPSDARIVETLNGA